MSTGCGIDERNDDRWPVSLLCDRQRACMSEPTCRDHARAPHTLA